MDDHCGLFQVRMKWRLFSETSQPGVLMMRIENVCDSSTNGFTDITDQPHVTYIILQRDY